MLPMETLEYRDEKPATENLLPTFALNTTEEEFPWAAADLTDNSALILTSPVIDLACA